MKELFKRLGAELTAFISNELTSNSLGASFARSNFLGVSFDNSNSLGVSFTS